MCERIGILIACFVLTVSSAEFFGCSSSSLSWKTCRNSDELLFQSCTNGTWNAGVCMKSDNIVLRDKLNFHDASSEKSLIELVDGNDGTHVSIKANENVNWTVDLKKLYYLYAIVIVTYNSHSSFLVQVETVFRLKSNEIIINKCELLSQPQEMQNQYFFYCFDTFQGTVRGILSHRINVRMQNQHHNSQTVEVAQIKLYENQGVACGDPANILNGNFTFDNQGQMKNVQVHPGARITYWCNEGFQLSGKPVTRTCMPNGWWNGTAPTCINTSFTTVDQSCSALDVPLHGNLLNQRSSLDGRNTILNYSCKEGYKLVSQNDKKRNNGDLKVFCDKGRWNPSLQPAPVCQRVLCPYPEKENGTYWILVNQTTVEGSIAVYQCMNGTNNSSLMTKICNPISGTWTNLTRGVNCSEIKSEIARLETLWVVLPLVVLCILALVCVTYNYNLWQQRVRLWLVHRLKLKSSSSQQLSNVQYRENVDEVEEGEKRFQMVAFTLLQKGAYFLLEEGEVAFGEEEHMDVLTHQISTTSSRYSRYSDHTYERISLLVPPPTDSENDDSANSDSIYAKVLPRSEWMNSSLHSREDPEDDAVVA